MAKQSKANQRKSDMAAFHRAQAESRVLKVSKSCNLSVNEEKIGAKGIKQHPNGQRLNRRTLNKRIKAGLIPSSVRTLCDDIKAGKVR